MGQRTVNDIASDIHITLFIATVLLTEVANKYMIDDEDAAALRRYVDEAIEQAKSLKDHPDGQVIRYPAAMGGVTARVAT